MPKAAITLTFQTIECERCGVWRVRAAPCPDCGMEPRSFEVQHDVEKRARIVEECLATPRTGEKADSDWDATLADVPSIVDRINRSLQRAARGKVGSAEVNRSFEEIDRHINAWRDRQLRPGTNQGRVLYRSLVLLRGGFETFLKALAARDVGEAQALERSGQELLDRAAATINDLETLRGSEATVGMPLSGFYAQVAREARIADGLVEEVDQLDRLTSQTRFERGDLLARMIHHLMLAAFDLDQAMAVVKAITRHLDSDGGFYTDPSWLREHSRVVAVMSASAFALTNLDDDSSEFESVKTLLELVKDCREALIRHALATLLAESPTDYKRLLRKGTGHVITKAAQKYPDLMLDENLSPAIRHAIAHSDFDWVDGAFVTHSDGGEARMPEAEFLDRCFACFETACSLFLGIHEHAASLGYEIAADAHLSPRDRRSAIEMALVYFGYSDVSAEFDRNVVKITASGSLEQFVAMAGCVVAVGMPEHSRLELTLRDDEGQAHLCTTDLEVIRRCNPTEAADENDAVTRATEIMAVTQFDGRSAWSEEEWLTAAFALSVSAPGESPIESIRRVKRVQQLAQAGGVTVEHENWRLILAMLRGKATNPEPVVPAAFRRGP